MQCAIQLRLTVCTSGACCVATLAEACPIDGIAYVDNNAYIVTNLSAACAGENHGFELLSFLQLSAATGSASRKSKTVFAISNVGDFGNCAAD